MSNLRWLNAATGANCASLSNYANGYAYLKLLEQLHGEGLGVATDSDSPRHIRSNYRQIFSGISALDVSVAPEESIGILDGLASGDVDCHNSFVTWLRQHFDTVTKRCEGELAQRSRTDADENVPPGRGRQGSTGAKQSAPSQVVQQLEQELRALLEERDFYAAKLLELEAEILEKPPLRCSGIGIRILEIINEWPLDF